MDPIEQFIRGSKWASQIVDAVKPDQVSEQTPCDEWDVRDLVNHMTEGLKVVGAAVRHEEPDPEYHNKDYVGDHPALEYKHAYKETIAAVQERDGDVLEETFKMPYGESPAAMTFGIYGVDQLVHGWDLAKATGQDTEMPADLAEAAFATVDGRLTDEQRGEVFKKEIKPPANASVQEKLLAYTGRKP